MEQKILVIEDTPDTLSCIIELLQDEGFEAIGAKNGLIGLKLAKEEIPDLVISDINMPEINGYQVLSQLRQHPQTANIPVILMSGEKLDYNRTQSFNTFADDYLLKPVMPQKLIEVIAEKLKKIK